MPPYQRAISPHDNGNVEDGSNDDDGTHDSLYKIDTIINRNTECLRRNIADDAVGRRSSPDTARLEGPTKQVLSRCDYPAAVHDTPGLATKRAPPPEQRHRTSHIHSTTVTFAGRVMPYTHPENNDGHQIVHLFWDAVHICEIPPRAEYTHAEQRAMWYTREELERMKQVSVETVQKTLQLLQFHQQQCSRRHPQKNISTTTTMASKESLGYCRFFFLRGLEKVVDHYTSTTSTRTTNNGRTPSRTTSTTYQRRYDSIYAVLTEQYAQRMECLHHGQVGYGVVYDDQRLKRAYQSHQRTRTSLDEAHGLAHQDAILAVEQYTTTNPDKCEAPSDPDQYCDPHQYGYHPNKKEKTVSTTKQTWSPFLLFPLASLVVDKETRELLPVVHEMLLTAMQRMLPFLEVRSKENAVWDIDHNIEEQNVVAPAASCGTRGTYLL